MKTQLIQIEQDNLKTREASDLGNQSAVEPDHSAGPTIIQMIGNTALKEFAFQQQSNSQLFKPGDFVRLRNSDQELMVESYVESGVVICSFWEGITRNKDRFSETALEIIPYLATL